LRTSLVVSNPATLQLMINPSGPLQRVSSGTFPGAELHILCNTKPVKARKSGLQPLFRQYLPSHNPDSIFVLLI
ncbi:MAG: hypothetical protein Q4C92_07730, partial [Clostridia bacterium]|nr:hypothetical protein [Clostridia bacterium]